MNYNQEILQTEIDLLLGDSIQNIFHYTEYKGYETFKQLPNSIVEIPLLGMLLETSSGNFFNVISYDYAPYYNLGGICIFRDKSLITPQGRPNQVNEVFWKHYRNKEITSALIIENYYRKEEEEITIPFGIKLGFQSNKECYILNLSIEDFFVDSHVFNFCRGGELILCSERNILDKYSILKTNTFKVG